MFLCASPLQRWSDFPPPLRIYFGPLSRTAHFSSAFLIWIFHPFFEEKKKYLPSFHCLCLSLPPTSTTTFALPPPPPPPPSLAGCKMDSPQSEPPREEQKAEETRRQGELQTGRRSRQRYHSERVHFLTPGTSLFRSIRVCCLAEVQPNSRCLLKNMLIPGFVYILSFCVWEERLSFSYLILCLCYVTQHIFNLLRACIHHIHSIICACVCVVECVCVAFIYTSLWL